MASEISQVLAETLSTDNNRRVAAELKLAKLSEYPGLCKLIAYHKYPLRHIKQRQDWHWRSLLSHKMRMFLYVR